MGSGWRGGALQLFYAGFEFQRCTSVALPRVGFKCRGTSFVCVCVFTLEAAAWPRGSDIGLVLSRSPRLLSRLLGRGECVVHGGCNLRQESCMTQPFGFIGPSGTYEGCPSPPTSPSPSNLPDPPPSLLTESATCLLASKTLTPALPRAPSEGRGTSWTFLTACLCVCMANDPVRFCCKVFVVKLRTPPRVFFSALPCKSSLCPPILMKNW